MQTLELISYNPNSGKFTPQWIKTKFDIILNACFLNVKLAHLQKDNKASFSPKLCFKFSSCSCVHIA